MSTAPLHSRPTFGSVRHRSHRTVPVALLWTTGAATVLMGLIAGFFYAYACSVMVGLARVDDHTFVHTMQAINATVRNAAFAPAFFGSLVVTAVAAGWAYRSGLAARRWILAAFLLYVSAFVITMGVSVPLNEQLAAAGAPDQITDLAAVRARYEGPWVLWNVVRTVLSTAALGLLIVSTARLRAEPASPAARR